MSTSATGWEHLGFSLLESSSYPPKRAREELPAEVPAATEHLCLWIRLSILPFNAVPLAFFLPLLLSPAARVLVDAVEKGRA